MRLRYPNNQTNSIKIPKDLRKWIFDYDLELAPAFFIDLSEEMPGEAFGIMQCWVNRTENLALLKRFESQYADIEGNNAGYVIREVNNIFASEDKVTFRIFEGLKKGFFGIPKHNLITLDKAILVIEYVIANFSYPGDIEFTDWWEINQSPDNYQNRQS